MARMTNAQLVDENIRLRHNIAVLESQLLNAEQYIARMEAPGAQRQVARPQGAKLVREFTNADGVRMGKFEIGFNRYAYRPMGAQA